MILHNVPPQGIQPQLTLQRRHGLGNIICLIPVLDRFYSEGYQVTVITRAEWIHAFSTLRPGYLWSDVCDEEAIDLDEMTSSLKPTLHRTDEFGHLLGLGSPFDATRLEPPALWSNPFSSFRDCVVFAPECGHPARQWPAEKADELKSHLPHRQMILVGQEADTRMACDVDLRGRLDLHELIGLLSIAGVVITMDSAVMHLAAALDRPTVALFGGIEPAYRIRPEQRIVVLQAEMDCCPCNKNETCSQEYACIHTIEPADVARAVGLSSQIERRTIYRKQDTYDHVMARY